MNLFTGLLYTQGYLLDPRYAEDVPRDRPRDSGARKRDREAEWAHASRQPATPPGRTRVVASYR